MLSASATGSVTRLSFLSQFFNGTHGGSSSFSPPTSTLAVSINPSSITPLLFFKRFPPPLRPFCTLKASETNGIVAVEAQALGVIQEKSPPEQAVPTSSSEEESPETEASLRTRRSADWKAANTYKESGSIYEGKIVGSNGGGLLIRFYSIIGFLPYTQLSPYYSCKDRQKSRKEIAGELTGSQISVKVIEVDEEKKKLIFSEREVRWSKFSKLVKVEDIFKARVGAVEDYGAFVHLRFPDGDYHLTGFVHISEVSWDLVQDVRDILREGDDVTVKVIRVDREKSRITLSIKQLEDDPLLETLDKVIPPQDIGRSEDSPTTSYSSNIEPLPGLDGIFKELLQEDGISDVQIHRQGFEKRVVSQDLQLWLSNLPPAGDQYTILARAGRQVQEIHLTTTLDQDGIKKALNRVLERVP